eukprot:3613446-Alexandrium_andersonii.AAC.1
MESQQGVIRYVRISTGSAWIHQGSSRTSRRTEWGHKRYTVMKDRKGSMQGLCGDCVGVSENARMSA